MYFDSNKLPDIKFVPKQNKIPQNKPQTESEETKTPQKAEPDNKPEEPAKGNETAVSWFELDYKALYELNRPNNFVPKPVTLAPLQIETVGEEPTDTPEPPTDDGDNNTGTTIYDDGVTQTTTTPEGTVKTVSHSRETFGTDSNTWNNGDNDSSYRTETKTYTKNGKTYTVVTKYYEDGSVRSEFTYDENNDVVDGYVKDETGNYLFDSQGIGNRETSDADDEDNKTDDENGNNKITDDEGREIVEVHDGIPEPKKEELPDWIPEEERGKVLPGEDGVYLKHTYNKETDRDDITEYRFNPETGEVEITKYSVKTYQDEDGNMVEEIYDVDNNLIKTTVNGVEVKTENNNETKQTEEEEPVVNPEVVNNENPPATDDKPEVTFSHVDSKTNEPVFTDAQGNEYTFYGNNPNGVIKSKKETTTDENGEKRIHITTYSNDENHSEHSNYTTDENGVIVDGYIYNEDKTVRYYVGEDGKLHREELNSGETDNKTEEEKETGDTKTDGTSDVDGDDSQVNNDKETGEGEEDTTDGSDSITNAVPDDSQDNNYGNDSGNPAFDESAALATHVEHDGNGNQIWKSDDGKIRVVIDANGTKHTYTYDENGKINGRRDEYLDGRVDEYADVNGTMECVKSYKIEDEKDDVNNSQEPSVNNPNDDKRVVGENETIEIKDADGNVIGSVKNTYEYINGKKVQVSETKLDSSGKIISQKEFVYDKNGVLIKTYEYTVDENGNTIEKTTDEITHETKITKITDRNGNDITNDELKPEWQEKGFESEEDYENAKKYHLEYSADAYYLAMGIDNKDANNENIPEWQKAEFDNEDDYNLAKSLGYADNAKGFYNTFGNMEGNYVEIKDKNGNVIGRSCVDENGNVIKLMIKLPDGFIRIQNTKDGSYEMISPDGIHCKYKYVNGKETLISATNKDGKDVTADVQRAIGIENVVNNIINGEYGRGANWDRDAAINALVSAGANVWSLTQNNSPMFSQACNDLINAYKNGTLDQFLNNALAGNYGGGKATNGSYSSGGSESGNWGGSYTKTSYNTWTDENGNTTTVDPLSGINWGRGFTGFTPDGVLGGGSSCNNGNGGSHY